MTTRERKERKADQLREWAEKRETAAVATLKQTEHFRGDHAFNTQPGHIPERARIIAREDRAVESLNKAAGMNGRANGIESQLDRSIYSDDTDAVARLRERIATLEAEREAIKTYNASARKAKATHGDLSLLSAAQRSALMSAITYQPYACKYGQFPAYASSNLGSEITRYRKRLEEAERPPEQEHGRFLWVKYPGVCRVCGTTLDQGAQAIYFKQARELACYPPCNSGKE